MNEEFENFIQDILSHMKGLNPSYEKKMEVLKKLDRESLSVKVWNN